MVLFKYLVGDTKCQYFTFEDATKQMVTEMPERLSLFFLSPKLLHIQSGVWTRRGSNPYLHHDRETCSHLHHGPDFRVYGINRRKLKRDSRQKRAKNQNGKCLGLRSVRFFVSLLAIADCHARSQGHEGDWRK